MVINIEQAQNGFVVRDTADGGTNPILINDFNSLVNVLVQAFQIKVEGAGGEDLDDKPGDMNAPETSETSETDSEDESTDDA